MSEGTYLTSTHAAIRDDHRSGSIRRLQTPAARDVISICSRRVMRRRGHALALHSISASYLQASKPNSNNTLLKLTGIITVHT